ncbi:MAG: polysaccharide biosynthesis C-terminal domain-containing protein, partial [Ruminococcus sp.]|nr:polysaccharide biosynthesis C-terminal domain-containing protein [Ruminococcus sp.]
QHDEAGLCVVPLTWLMPGMVCLCLSYPLFAMLQGIGRASAPLKITAAGTVVKFLGNVLLIPEMGLTGAALSTTISFAVILIAAAAVYCRASGIRPEFAPFLAVLYAGGMCGGGAYLAYSLAERGGLSLLWSLIFAISAGGSAYLVTAYIVFGIKKENAILLRRSQKLS